MLCCGAPDDANELDQHEPSVPANKVSKVGQRPTTASRPDSASVQQDSGPAQLQTEKDALKIAESGTGQNETNSAIQSGINAPSSANGQINGPVNARDQPLPSLPKEAETSTLPSQSTPAVIVQAPEPNVGQNTSEKARDSDGDIKMEEPEPLSPKKEENPAPAIRRDENVKAAALPPPPPVQPPPSEDSNAPESVDGKQQWLLPPIAPRFKGKKCLVLDLDETLVHSSFKVCICCHACFICANSTRYYTKLISPSQSRSKGNFIMFMSSSDRALTSS